MRTSGCLLLVLALAWGSAPLFAAQPDSASAPRTLEAFVRAFESAFSGDDLAAARNLFYWRGISEPERRRIDELILADLSRELVAVAILPLGSAATGTTFEKEGVPYAPNVELIGHLLAKFNDPDREPHYSLHNVGVSNGVFYIGLAVPAS